MWPWHYRMSDVSVWIDASYEIVSPDFAEMVLDTLSTTDLALFRHPHRDCIYEEAKVSKDIPKYADEPIQEQADHYQAAGHPEHWGLWECGFIARRHTEQIRDLSEDWWNEINRWSIQDQLSFPVVCRRAGVRPTEFEGTRWDNPWLVWHDHLRND